jgi:DNA polymerase (family X)
VRCVVNCDAHKLHHAGWLRLGAHIARKGGLAAAEVINTLPLPKLREALAAKRKKHGL